MIVPFSFCFFFFSPLGGGGVLRDEQGPLSWGFRHKAFLGMQDLLGEVLKRTTCFPMDVLGPGGGGHGSVL